MSPPIDVPNAYTCRGADGRRLRSTTDSVWNWSRSALPSAHQDPCGSQRGAGHRVAHPQQGRLSGGVRGVGGGERTVTVAVEQERPVPVGRGRRPPRWHRLGACRWSGWRLASPMPMPRRTARSGPVPLARVGGATRPIASSENPPSDVERRGVRRPPLSVAEPIARHETCQCS